MFGLTKESRSLRRANWGKCHARFVRRTSLARPAANGADSCAAAVRDHWKADDQGLCVRLGGGGRTDTEGCGRGTKQGRGLSYATCATRAEFPSVLSSSARLHSTTTPARSLCAPCPS